MNCVNSCVTLMTPLFDFLDYWLNLESVEENTAAIMVLLIVTHVCGILMIICEPVFITCFGYFGTFTLLEMIAIFFWSMTLLSLYYCQRYDTTHSQTVMKIVHYLHIAGFMWIPAVISHWFMCFEPIIIPSILNNKPATVLNFAPPSLSGCFDNPTNCYIEFLFTYIGVLLMFTMCGISFSVVNVIIYIMSERWPYGDEFSNSGTASTTRNRMRLSYSLVSLVDSYSQLHSKNIFQRDGMNTNNSSSDEGIPLNIMGPSCSSAVEPDTITLVKKDNKGSGRSQQYEFEVHQPKSHETEV